MSDIPTYMNKPSHYSDEEIFEAAQELDEKVSLDFDTLEEKLLNLLNHAVPIEEAKEAIIQDSPRTYTDVDDYERFESWEGSSPPPRVEEDTWTNLSDDLSGFDIAEIGRDLVDTDEYVVYCIECGDLQDPLREVQRQANLMLGEIPSWVEQAYTADHSFYIGQSGNFGRRLRTHATGILSDKPAPSALVALFGMEAFGIVRRVESREKAEDIEEYYAENLRDVGQEHGDILVYYA